ncbi:sensor domain-containing diguanylate cyclase [Burkholderiaceae bacterium DAT-1]|nr:sensor domain-containing diguanylate cyclase [Burkholderiaceae bacterium DAT-1]
MPLACQAVTLLDDKMSGRFVNDQAFILKDPTGQMTINDVMHATGFKPLNGLISIGVAKQPVWIRIELENTAADPHWQLEIRPFLLYDFRAWVPDTSGGLKEYRMGEREPFSARPYPWRQYLLPMHLPAGTSRTVYLRIQHGNHVILPIQVYRMQHWSGIALRDSLLFGAGFGIVAAFALYNIFLFARLRDRMFLLYGATILSYAWFMFDLYGFGSQWLYPHGDFLGPARNVLPNSLSNVFCALYALYMLDSPDAKPYFRRIMWASIPLYGLAIICMLARIHYLSVLINQVVPAITVSLVMYTAVQRIRQGQRTALYILLGLLPALISMTLLVLVRYNILPYHAFPIALPLAGEVIESILFSQALAERFIKLRRDKAQAMQRMLEEKNLRLSEALRHEVELEAKIAERTEALQRSEARLRDMAFQDGLTGLPNRRLFDDRLEALLNQAIRQDAPFALCIIDLDGFKPINDQYGHDAGDAVLREIAERFASLTRAGDTVARLGGDEFALLLPNFDNRFEAHSAFIERIERVCVPPVYVDGLILQVGASIGIARSNALDQLCADALFRAADQAMYAHKRSRRRPSGERQPTLMAP